MATVTTNLYGKIVITNKAIKTVAGVSALESVGVYGVGTRMKVITVDDLARTTHFGRTVQVIIKNNKIYLDINLLLKYGMSVDAVTESVRNSVKYNVENFSGMTVECININVFGIKK